MKYNTIFRSNPLGTLKLLFFSIAVFCYYAQFFFISLSSFIVPILGIYLLFTINDVMRNLNRSIILVISIYYVYLLCILLLSAFLFIGVTRIIRFLLILVTIPLFFLDVHKQTKNYYFNIFIFFSCLKAISLIAIYIIFLKLGSYRLLNEYFRTLGTGGIFTSGEESRHLYIQVQGNALMLIAFMLRFFRTKNFDFVNIILFLGIMLAGNFAFYLGLIAFFVYCVYVKIIDNRKEWYITIIFAFLAFIVFACLFFPYVDRQIQRKSVFSNVVRIEQTKLLLSGNVFTGNGIGNPIKAVTSTRFYNDELYYELQSLYIINQIGFIGYFLFMFCTLYILYKKNRKMIILYLIYLLYSFWNPYCFDTTHMITALLIINEQVPLKKYE